MEPTHVIYHDNCYDGFTAAYVLYQVFPEALYIPGQYGETMPPVPGGARVVMVDVSWPRPELEGLRKRVDDLVILDHHKTAQGELDGFPGAIFDMERSGAGLAFDWLHGGEGPPRHESPLVDHVEDRDLWEFQIPGTKPIHALLSSYERTFENWRKVDHLLTNDPSSAYNEGAAIRRYQERRYDEVADLFHLVNLEGAVLPAANVGLAQFKSGGIHAFLEKHPEFNIAAAYGRGPDGEWYWSLRARDGHDCSELAKEMGGGGHAQASGFRIVSGPLYAGEIEQDPGN